MKLGINLTTMLILAVGWLGGGCHPAVAPPAALETYNPVQTQDEVRVVLLEVAQLTLFTDQWSAEPQAAGISAAPAFKVVWLIEVPQPDAFSALTINSTNLIQVSVEGKVVSDTAVHGISHGISSSSVGFSESTVKSLITAPKPPPSRAAIVEETVLRGVRVEADHIDLSLRLNWKKHDLVFDFKDVPVN